MANNWRGCKNIQMVSHGEWNDPELVTDYGGVEYWFNYWDIEEALWYDFLESEGIEEKDTYDERGNISAEYEDKFSKYCQDNAYTYITYDVIPELDKDHYTKDGEKWFWIERDVANYNADLDSDEEDYDYDDEDIDESCSGSKKKKKKLKEDIDTDDLNSAVYNALTDVCFEFMNKGNHPTEEEMNIAIEWWQTHFWE